MKKYLKHVLTGLALCLIAYLSSYFVIDYLPTLKDECPSNIKGLSLIDFAIVSLEYIIAFALVAGFLFVYCEIMDRFKVSESWIVGIAFLLVALIPCIFVSIFCYVQYQFCGQITVEEWLMLKI